MVFFFNGFAQNRRDLIWEYKKLLANDSHLGIRLEKEIDQCSDQEIKLVLDKAWEKKKSIVLMQLLGYLDNPPCDRPMFDDAQIRSAIEQFKKKEDLSSDFPFGDKQNKLLLNSYLHTDNVNHLPVLIKTHSLTYDNIDILYVAYKSELEFQFWAKNKNSDSSFEFIASFPITDSAVSVVGPKSKYGDSLTPEGIYSMDFYPSFRWSDFYLAFRINYPNNLDYARRKYWNIVGNVGGDINLHGCCISIGCIPIGNPAIEEIFFITRMNQINNSNICIMIFPFNFDNDDQKNLYYQKYSDKPKLINFWKSLENCHEYFKTNQRIPDYDKNQKTGNYILNGT